MHSKWKDRLDQRQSKFTTTHDSLKVVDTLEDLASLYGGKTLFGELPFDFPILVRSSLMNLKQPCEEEWNNVHAFANLIGA